MEQQLLQFINDYKKFLIAGVILLLCVFSILNNNRRYQEKVKDLHRTVEEWDEKMSLGEELAKKEQMYENINKNLLRDFFELKQIIDAAANKHKVVFDSLRQALKSEKELFREIEVQVNLRGSYDQVMKFIAELEKSPSVRVAELRLTMKDNVEELDVSLGIIGLIRSTQ